MDDEPSGSPRGTAWVGVSLLGLLVVIAAGVVRSESSSWPVPRRPDRPRTVVSLTFDDGNDDQRLAETLLQANGLVGTFFVISGSVGTPGYVSVEDLKRFAADGQEIGGHTVNHLPLTTLSDDEAARQICNDRANLLGWGLPVTDFAMPFADADDGTQAAVRRCGYNSARGLKGLCTGTPPTRTRQSGCVTAESIPPADPYPTRALNQVDSTWTQADLRGAVTGAQQSGGGWVQLTFHHICDGCSPAAVRPADLDAFLSWLKERAGAGDVTVETVHEVIGGTVKPAVRLSPPPPAGKGVNAIENPSLEVSGPDGMPDCWEQAGFGANTATLTREHAGHAGRSAVTLRMSGWSSGDTKLMPRRDLGQCAPSVVPGHRYALDAWYSSSVRTQFAVYYRTTTGNWRYLTSGPWLAMSPSAYVRAHWVTPPVPADAAGLSFGLSLSTNGHLTTDDYLMSDVT